MAGEPVELTAAERPRFEQLATYYREYRRILESVDASGFESLQDLGHAIRYGELRDQPDRATQFVNDCFDRRPEGLVARLLETTLGTHLINLTAFERLTDERKVRLFELAAEICRERALSGYGAGAFVIGSLVDPRSSIAFWERFQPYEVAFLISEWVLHQKYLSVLNVIGEKKISKAKEVILGGGLTSVPGLAAAAAFMNLKLSRIDLGEVQRAVPEGGDPQTGEIIGLLLLPFGTFFDFGDRYSVAGLIRICEAGGVPVPGPDDC
jgi:hypothetical protein